MNRHLLLAAAALALAVPTMAQAGVVEGKAYLNQTSIATDALVSSEGSLPAPNLTFTVPSPANSACAGSLFSGDTLCFNSGYTNTVGATSNTGGAYTLGGFLSSGGATVVTGGTSTNLNASLDNTVLVFTGTVTVTHGETFTAGHDDGLDLQIDGVDVIDEPSGTPYAVTSETYTGPTGTEAFNLIYGECCGAPAALGISLPFQSSVPEPLTLSLFGAGLAGMAAMRRRKKA